MRYLATVKYYDKEKDKEVTEVYLLHADTYTEAEAMIYSHVQPDLPTTAFTLESLNKILVQDLRYIVSAIQDKFFLVKANQWEETEKGIKKKTVRYIVNAKDFESSVAIAKEYNRGFMSLTETAQITEMPVIKAYGAGIELAYQIRSGEIEVSVSTPQRESAPAETASPNQVDEYNRALAQREPEFEKDSREDLF